MNFSYIYTKQITMSFSVPFKLHFKYNGSFHIKNHLRRMTFCILYIDITILLIINKAVLFLQPIVQSDQKKTLS